MLTDAELDALEAAGESPSWNETEKLIAQARAANRYRRDHEAMNVMRHFPDDGLVLYGNQSWWQVVREKCSWWAENVVKSKIGPTASDPADALIEWRRKYGGRETSDAD